MNNGSEAARGSQLAVKAAFIDLPKSPPASLSPLLLLPPPDKPVTATYVYTVYYLPTPPISLLSSPLLSSSPSLRSSPHGSNAVFYSRVKSNARNNCGRVVRLTPFRTEPKFLAWTNYLELACVTIFQRKKKGPKHDFTPSAGGLKIEPYHLPFPPLPSFPVAT